MDGIKFISYYSHVPKPVLFNRDLVCALVLHPSGWLDGPCFAPTYRFDQPIGRDFADDLATTRPFSLRVPMTARLVQIVVSIDELDLASGSFVG
jgi:hypothetical protein